MKVSVITICYNAVDVLERTMLSVLNQTYSDVEYIIIDGGSTDGTIDIIKKFAERLAYWVSEPDKGIFDAMNKGIEMATGQWINFMNAGDVFHTEDILSRIANENIVQYSVLYGDTMACFAHKRIHLTASSIHLIKRNMPFCHQSSFVRTELLRQNKFDLSFKICADYNLFYSLYCNGYLFKQMEFIVADFDAETGISSTRKKELKKEISLITKRSIFSLNLEYFLRNLKHKLLRYV